MVSFGLWHGDSRYAQSLYSTNGRCRCRRCSVSVLGSRYDSGCGNRLRLRKLTISKVGSTIMTAMLDRSSLTPTHYSFLAMRVSTRYLGDAVASSSRGSAASSSRAIRSAIPISASIRLNHCAAFQASTPRLDKGKRREDIKYDIGGVAHSIERQAYFAQSASGSSSTSVEAVGSEWGVETEEVANGIEPGRVVECRRYVVPSYNGQ
jgi:hypothetical protein